MEWLKKHADTAMVLGSIITGLVWMNAKFNHIDIEMERRFSAIEKDVAIIKTVLIMQNVMPTELAMVEGK